MSDEHLYEIESDDPVESLSVNTLNVSAVCPNCDRSEEFGNHSNAAAWLNAHIRAEHPDELPPFENDD